MHEVLLSRGQPLDPTARSVLEDRLGHDFSHIQIHTDRRAAESARSVQALAYTVGDHVVFGAGQYAPNTPPGMKLLAHELTHAIQQEAAQDFATRPSPSLEPLRDGGFRLAIAPEVTDEPLSLEREAKTQAESFAAAGPALTRPDAATGGSHTLIEPAVLRTRVPLPSSIPLCGRTLTHVDVEPPRARPLEPCLPPTVLVTRINIVGRDLSTPTPGRGPQVFNLHIGYYRDPATGRYCAIADDSRLCLIGRCKLIGCFPTLREVLEAILEFLKKVLVVLGIIALAIVLALVLELLLPVLIPAGALLVASTEAPRSEAGPGTAIPAAGLPESGSDEETEAVT